jgi:HPr kinase/phosphorylase
MGSSSSLTTTLHGVFMDVFGLGVLLTGASGIGKSELALGLISLGHRLVADDAVDFQRITHDTVLGTCPPLLQDFLEVRGLGILNIRVMYGDDTIKNSKRLQLIANIVSFKEEELLAIDRLQGMYRSQTILGVDIPEVTIPVAPGRNMAVLVEGAVRNQVLKHTGYHSSDEFMKRANQLMSKEED